MGKLQTVKTPDELFSEATEGRDFSPGDLRLLLSGLTALRKAHEKPLNEIELQSIHSMIAYAAYTQGISEDTVSSILAAQFGTEDVKTIPSRCYQEMIEFLVDLEIGKLMN